MANTNSIVVSACDNELYIIAISTKGNISYQLCHILSGYNFKVDVVVNIISGTYIEPSTQNGLSGPLQTSYNVCIPSGTYSIMAVAIDWGGGQQANYSIKSNGVISNYGSGNYNPGPNPASVFWTTNNAALSQIIV